MLKKIIISSVVFALIFSIFSISAFASDFTDVFIVLESVGLEEVEKTIKMNNGEILFSVSEQIIIASIPTNFLPELENNEKVSKVYTNKIDSFTSEDLLVNAAVNSWNNGFEPQETSEDIGPILNDVKIFESPFKRAAPQKSSPT